MKEGWTYKKLGEIATDMYRGNGIKRDQVTKEGIPCVRYGEIYTTYNISFDKCVSHTKESYISSPKYFEHGDLLFAITGESVEDIGKTIAYLGYDKCLCGGDIICMKHKQNPKFLAYALSTPDAIRQKGIGKTKLKVVHTNALALKDIIIPIPTSLSEQQQIVERLDSAFAHIDELKANAEKQLNDAKALFQKALEKAMTPKEGWEEKTIIDVAEYKSGVAHEKVIDESGCYVVINSKFVSSEGKIRKYSNQQLAPLYENDIVMVLSDVPNGKTLAKCYIVEKNGLYTLNQRICAFKSKGIDNRFLYYMLNRNPNLLRYDNGENQTNLRVKNVLDCPVSYPKDLKIQQAIVSHLDNLSVNIKALEENLEKTISECDALKQAMLREVFSEE